MNHGIHSAHAELEGPDAGLLLLAAFMAPTLTGPEDRLPGPPA